MYEWYVKIIYIIMKGRENMGKTSAASKNKYAAKAYDQLRVLVKKGQKNIIADYAAAQGQSLNGYINKLIADDMGAALIVPKPEDPEK